MEIEYQNKVEDMIAFDRFVYDNPSPEQRAARRKSLLLFIAIPFMVILFLSFQGKFGSTKFIALTLSAFLLAAFLAVMNRPFKAMEIRARFKKEPYASFLGKKIQIAMNPDTVTISAGTDSTKLNWTSFQKIAATENYAFFCLPTNQGYVIPSRSFPHERCFLSFFETAKQFHQTALEKEQREVNS